MRRLAPLVALIIATSSLLITGRVGFASRLDNQAAPAAGSAPSTPAPDQRIDINTAGLDELMKAPGMTRVWAARIIRFRPYRAKNELIDKGVVSNQVYDRIKDYVIAHRAKQ